MWRLVKQRRAHDAVRGEVIDDQVDGLDLVGDPARPEGIQMQSIWLLISPVSIRSFYSAVLSAIRNPRSAIRNPRSAIRNPVGG
jgi:hypothetical protein